MSANVSEANRILGATIPRLNLTHLRNKADYHYKSATLDMDALHASGDRSLESIRLQFAVDHLSQSIKYTILKIKSQHCII